MKPIRWTPHVRKKMGSREVSEAEVEQTIRQPAAVIEGRPPRRIFMRRYFDEVLQTEMLLRGRGRNRNGDRAGHALQNVEVQEIRRRIMKAEYDRETDTLTITLRDVRVKESDEVRPGVIADFGYDGGVVGFEILDASKVVEQTREMQFAVAG
jgi:uncharacterized protein YuzE